MCSTLCGVANQRTVVELKSLGIPIDFSPNRLKRAHGEEVCTVIHSLLDMVIKKKEIQFLKPQFPASMIPTSDEDSTQEDDDEQEGMGDFDEINDAIGTTNSDDDSDEYYMEGNYVTKEDDQFVTR